MSKSQERIYYLDYARAFFIFLVVLDHSLHAYSENFGWLFFVKDSERDVFWDVIHLICYLVMIPGLFFLAGIFTPGSINRRGVFRYFEERIVRLLIPMAIGTVTLSGVLTYLKHYHTGKTKLNLWNYYLQDYLPKDLALTGYWFLGFLFTMTCAYLIISLIIPPITRYLKSLGHWLSRSPVEAYWVFGCLLALSFALLTLRYGAFYWYGYPYFLISIGSFIGAYIILFILGLAVGLSNLFKEGDLLPYLSDKLGVLALLTMGWVTVYLVVSLGWYESAFNEIIPYYFVRGGTWSNVWSLLNGQELVIVKGLLHGFATWSLMLFVIGIFYKYYNKPHNVWQSLAANSFAIYLTHEPFAVALQVLFSGTGMPIFFRVIIITSVSLGASWYISDKVLRRSKLVRRVLG